MSNESQENIQIPKAPKTIRRIDNYTDPENLLEKPDEWHPSRLLEIAEQCDLLDDRYLFFEHGETEEGMRSAGIIDANDTSLDCNDLVENDTSEILHIETANASTLKSPFGEDNLFCRISENEFMDLEVEKRFIARFTDKKQ